MLQFRQIPTQTKGIRVDVFRRYQSTDPTTQRSKVYYKEIGSFPLGSDYAPELLEQLEPEEIAQLQNWMAETRFAESLNVPLNRLERWAIRIPISLLEALTCLHLEASRADLDFVPHHIILTTLLQQARHIQQQIDLKNGFESAILEKAGLPPVLDTLEETDCASDPESQALFQTLLNLKQPVGRTCTELETVAAQYGKTKKIPPPQLKEWAGDIKHRSTHKRIKKWCYAIAIEVLRRHGVNATQWMSPARVADFWIRQNFSSYSVLEAPAAFIRLFEVPPAHHAAVMSAIARVYELILVTMPDAPLTRAPERAKTD